MSEDMSEDRFWLDALALFDTLPAAGWTPVHDQLQSVVIPRRPTLHDASQIQHTRDKLLARGLRLYQDADQRTVTTWCSAAELTSGKRDTIVHRHAKYVIPSGSVIVSSRLGLLVPVSTDALKTRLWDQEASQPRPNTIEVRRHNSSSKTSLTMMLTVSHGERTPQHYFYYHSYQLRLFDDVLLFHSALARRCFRDGSRYVITLAGALWPFEASSSRGNPIDFELNATAVVQTCATDVSFTEVRVYIHSARRAEAVMPAEMSKQEAAVLSSFVSSAHNSLLDSLERDIDAVLLHRLTG